MNSHHLYLSSAQNQRIKDVLELRNRRERDRTSLFLIEGYRELSRAMNASFSIESLYICPDFFLGENEDRLIALLQKAGTKVYRCSPNVFSKMSYRDRPDGLLAVAPQRHLTLNELPGRSKETSSPFFVVAEAIEKPGNLGTILRSSDAVAIDGLIVCDRCTDVYNPNTVRASVGTLFTVPVAESSSEECILWLKSHGIKIVAATPSALNEFTEVDLTGPVAIALGTEQLGLSEKWMQQADIQIRIPMCGAADSLNVAMAATLLLYEVFRQRRLKF